MPLSFDSTGFPIERHPEAQLMFEHYRGHRLEWGSLRVPDMPTACDLGLLTDMDMGRRLTLLFGARDGMAAGQYQAAEVFVFTFEGHTILADCEPGGRGTLWRAPPLANATLDGEGWPGFVDTLMAALDHPVSEADADIIWNRRPTYLARRRSRRDEQMLHDLLPIQTNPPPPRAKRL